MELNKKKNYQILIDEEILTYGDYVINRISFVPDVKLKHEYEITIVQWDQSLGMEYSKFYFIDDKDEEKYKESIKLNKKSDEFYHSIYVKSAYFNDFYFEKEADGQESIFPNKNEDKYRLLMNCIYDFLYKFRRRYLKEASDRFIDKLIDSKVYPEFSSDNIIDS